MFEWLQKTNNILNGIVWGPPALILLVAIGLFLTIRTKFIQFKRFGHMLKETFGKMGEKNEKKMILLLVDL